MRDSIHEYSDICFVAMPFGRKIIGSRPVPILGRLLDIHTHVVADFDEIYREVFKPAIGAVALPEGGRLIARRADEDLFSARINDEVCDYLEYSKIVLADLTGLNANVIWELGVRHRARPTGTVLFRQPDSQIPFDLNQIRAFPYSIRPLTAVVESRALVTRVLSESIAAQRPDSPVARALETQLEASHTDSQLRAEIRDAQRALLDRDVKEAIRHLSTAAERLPKSALIRVRLATLHRELGDWNGVVTNARAALASDSAFPQAHRELGIALNKMASSTSPPGSPFAGEEELRRAIELDSTDYDALSSLAGLLRRTDRNEEALQAYRMASTVSLGHPYPVLNELKTQAALGASIRPDARQLEHLRRGELLRTTQIQSNPPQDTPWSFFDLSEIRFLQGDYREAKRLLLRGKAYAVRWQLETHRSALAILAASSELTAQEQSTLSEMLATLESSIRVAA